MNAVTHLIKEHTELKEMFKAFEEAGERAYKEKYEIAQKVIEELWMHEQEEERIFYPAVQQKGNKELQDMVLEGIEEHRVADFLVEKIKNTAPEDETFAARFKVLTESVKHHINEEERLMFPEARKLLEDDLERLGEEMEALEQQLGG